jgi:hypothetical protein
MKVRAPDGRMCVPAAVLLVRIYKQNSFQNSFPKFRLVCARARAEP